MFLNCTILWNNRILVFGIINSVQVSRWWSTVYVIGTVNVTNLFIHISLSYWGIQSQRDYKSIGCHKLGWRTNTNSHKRDTQYHWDQQRMRRCWEQRDGWCGDFIGHPSSITQMTALLSVITNWWQVYRFDI